MMKTELGPGDGVPLYPLRAAEAGRAGGAAVTDAA